MSTLFEDKPTNPIIVEPDPPTGPNRTDHILVQVYLDERKRALNRADDLRNSKFAFFEVLYGQCFPGVQSKLKGFYDLDNRREDGDCAWLLTQVRQIALDFSQAAHPISAVHNAKVELFRLRQNHYSLTDYHSKFLELVEVAEFGGASFGEDPAVSKYLIHSSIFEGIRNHDPGRPPRWPSPPPESSFFPPKPEDEDPDKKDNEPDETDKGTAKDESSSDDSSDDDDDEETPLLTFRLYRASLLHYQEETKLYKKKVNKYE